MTQKKDVSRDDLQKALPPLHAYLTPREAKAVRTKLGIDKRAEEDVEEELLEAMAHELARLKKKQ